MERGGHVSRLWLTTRPHVLICPLTRRGRKVPCLSAFLSASEEWGCGACTRAGLVRGLNEATCVMDVRQGFAD